MSKLTEKNLNNLLDETYKKNSSVFLAGNRGSGKTTVLNYIEKNCPNCIDVSIRDEEYQLIKNVLVYNLYHTCLVINKILNKYRDTFSINDSEYIYFTNVLDSLFSDIIFMYATGKYKSNLIDSDVLNNPNKLIKIMKLLLKNNGIDTNMILLIDDFDRTGNGSQMYQSFILNNLKQEFKLIMAISDKEMLCSEYSDMIVDITYNYDVSVVKEILNNESMKVTNEEFCVNNILTDEIILNLINKTDGNIYVMLMSIRELYRNIDEILSSEYQEFLLNHIDYLYHEKFSRLKSTDYDFC